MSKLSILLLGAAMLASCKGRHDGNKSQPGLEDVELTAKYDFYLAQQNEIDDANGFTTGQCDDLLFSGLVGSLECSRLNITAARDPDGRWYRRALPEGAACDREISRDMFYGVVAYALNCRDVELLKQVRAYGREHINAVGAWAMAPNGDGRQLILPDQQALIGESIGSLGGEAGFEKDFPRPVSDSVTGFNAHLQTLSILEYGKAKSGITTSDLAALRAQAKRQPRNPLFQAAVYRYSPDAAEREAAKGAALAVLMDEGLFPVDRLPGSANYCTDWITQRDDDPKDWSPCPDQAKTHTGGDFLFSAALLLGRF